MKKNSILSIALLLSSITLQAGPKGKCTINGTVSDLQNGSVMIRNLTKPVNDTIQIVNGKFKYVAEIDEVFPYLLTDEANKYQLFFAEPNSTINITLKRKDMQVTYLDGSPSHEVFRKLLVAQEPLQQTAMFLSKEYSKPTPNTDSLNGIMNIVNAELKKNFFTFLQEHKSSEVAAFVVYSSVTNDKSLNVNTADTMLSMLEGKALTSFYGKELNSMLSKLKATEVGYMAPDFTLPDSTGKKNFTLSSFKGKYVLIDFWASWCGPCKQEIPYLKQAYTKFHDKGFEIISVSLDDKKPNWTNALNHYQMPWVHISDVKGFNSRVNELYYVPSIPKTLLLDKTGKIIAKDLRGPALDAKLAELLK
jgi:thiol-disulfide isomerase/thioredoxin